jgi:P-type Ca2+ transporter type 2C
VASRRLDQPSGLRPPLRADPNAGSHTTCGDITLKTALRRPNFAHRWALIGVTAMLSLTLFWTLAGALFHFGPLHLNDLAVTVGAGAALLIVLGLLKAGLRRWLQT